MHSKFYRRQAGTIDWYIINTLHLNFSHGSNLKFRNIYYTILGGGAIIFYGFNIHSRVHALMKCIKEFHNLRDKFRNGERRGELFFSSFLVYFPSNYSVPFIFCVKNCLYSALPSYRENGIVPSLLQ